MRERLTKAEIQACRPLLEGTYWMALRLLRDKIKDPPLWLRFDGRCRDEARRMVDLLEEMAEE